MAEGVSVPIAVHDEDPDAVRPQELGDPPVAGDHQLLEVLRRDQRAARDVEISEYWCVAKLIVRLGKDAAKALGSRVSLSALRR